MAIDEESPDATILNETLQKVAKGASIVFVGSIFSMIVAFLARILIARNYTQSEYGIFSLGYTILFILATVGTLGLQDGAARQIAYYTGKKYERKVGDVIFYSILFGSLTGIILFFLAFFLSDAISVEIFHLPIFSFFLKELSIAIPFFILILILVSIFRGIGRVKEKVIFGDIAKNLLFLLALLYVIQTKLAFSWAILSYSVSIIVTSIIFLFYFFSKFGRYFPSVKLIGMPSFLSGKELLFFSLPLIFVIVMSRIMGWMDTLMLGYFKNTLSVGLYNAALPIAQFIPIAMGSMRFIYMPIVSTMYAKKQIYGIKRSYTVITKWLCAVTFPLAIVFVFFPKISIVFLFGSKYAAAESVLQILSIGFFIVNLMGPNGITLLAIGKIKFLSYAIFIGASINVILNTILIPIYGINGAAIATVIAFISMNIIRSVKLYSIFRIHSLEKNIIRPMLLSIILFFFIYFIAKNFLIITFWVVPILFIIFLILYFISLLLTKSFDREDIEMLSVIEKRTGFNLAVLKRLISLGWSNPRK